MIAKIAVSAAVFAIDKPYSYRVAADQNVAAGMRVIVPFGRGNRRSEGIVLEVSDEFEENLKAVERVLDETPVLTERQLRVAAFIRERYFCTFYEAARAILPAGVWFQATQTYEIVRDAGDWRVIAARNETALAVMQALEDMGGCTDERALRVQFTDEDALQSALRYLLARKLITQGLDMAQRVGSKTERMASLCVSADEAMAYAMTKQKSAPLQKAALELLCTVESGSCREISYLTGASMATLRRLEKLGMIEITEREVLRTPQMQPIEPAEDLVLTPEQQAAFDTLCGCMNKEKPGVALLHGVTGSGKTAVYIRLIKEALANGKGAILLVPEIALTPQLLSKLRGHFGDLVAVLHSSLRVTERYDTWRKIKEGKASVVVGTRSAVFAPVENPGILILDEEQEHTYKSENAPRYHAREVAIFRGVQENCLVLLGSATPSIESMYRAKTGIYTLCSLQNRYNGRELPRAQMVDMKQEIRRGNAGTISETMEEALRDRIIDGKQSILFLNRRGNSRYLACVECGDAPSCPRCSVHLTYHSANHRLMCHYCGYSQAVPDRCPTCGGPLKQIGSGTQKIEEELKAIFPDTDVLRMDADTLSASNDHEAILSRFEKERIPILLGTQMVAKGLDFENVTLVGVMDADMSLYVNSFRAAETTFSLVTQVVGRSGRGSDSGTALIQTMTPEHPVLQLAAEQDYERFYEMEIRLRELRQFPPFRDITTLKFTGLQEDAVMRAAMAMREALLRNLPKLGLTDEDVSVLGPVPAPVAKVNYTYRYQLSLSCKNTKQVRQMLAYLLRAFAKDPKTKGVSAFADVNSYD